jgi:aryl-alcohol dehydrogenase-like predicted oxidoreductase
MEPAYTYKAYDASPDYVRKSCEASLKRLGTDYLDLYQIHRIDYLAHPQETARGLEDLKREGKIRHAGVSNYTTDEIRALSSYIRLESLQTQFSLLHIEPLETGLQQVCLEKQMTILAFWSLHQGVLTGQKELAHDDWQVQREQGIVGQMQSFAADYGLNLGQLALSWLVQLPGGVIPLVGTTRAEHIEEAARAAEIELSRDDWYELLVIARGRPMPWYQRPYFYPKER